MKLLTKTEHEKKKKIDAQKDALVKNAQSYKEIKITESVNKHEQEINQKMEAVRLSAEKEYTIYQNMISDVKNEFENLKKEKKDFIESLEEREKSVQELFDKVTLQSKELDVWEKELSDEKTRLKLMEEILNRREDFVKKAEKECTRNIQLTQKGINDLQKDIKDFENARLTFREKAKKLGRELEQKSIQLDTEKTLVSQEKLLVEEALKQLEEERNSFTKLKARYAGR